MKWMRFAGIAGFILILGILLGVIYISLSTSLLSALFTSMPPQTESFSGGEEVSQKTIFQSSENQVIFIPIATVVLLSTIFFLYGFLKMGKMTESRFLTFPSVSLMIILGTSLLFFLIFFLLFSSFFSQASPSKESIKIFIFLGEMIVLLASFAFLSAIILGIGLVEVSIKVKFAKGAGILYLFFLGCLVFLFLSINITSILTDSLFVLGTSFISSGIMLLSITGISILFFLGFIFFSSLALLNASQRFERAPLPPSLAIAMPFNPSSAFSQVE